jgi:hypothetical protein
MMYVWKYKISLPIFLPPLSLKPLLSQTPRLPLTFP